MFHPVIIKFNVLWELQDQDRSMSLHSEIFNMNSKKWKYGSSSKYAFSQGLLFAQCP